MRTDSKPEVASDLALLGLMQLVSPALPIGAFAWSQGLESAFEFVPLTACVIMGVTFGRLAQLARAHARHA